MIVYVVTSGCYSDYCIEAVFDDKEQAELYCATHESNEIDIEEYDTEEHHFDSSTPLFLRWDCEISERSFGTELINLRSTLTFKRVNGIHTHAVYRTKWISGHVTLDRNSTKEQAKKAILDRYALWKYEREC